MKGGCTDLRNKGPNSPVKVFSLETGKYLRTEKATTIDDFVGRHPAPVVGVRKDEHFVPWARRGGMY